MWTMGETSERKGSRLWRFLVLSLLGFLLLWLGGGLLCAIGERLLEKPELNPNAAWALGGFGAYLVLHLFFHRPLLSHILAHELTHALAALLVGGKVTAVHATTEGGSTLINKSHWLISLAPYVFPFYSVLALGVWALAAPAYRPALSFLVGFLYAFHWALTIFTLTHPQPDLEDAGPVFSLIFIFTGNMMNLMLMLIVLWPEAFTLASAFDRTTAWSFRLVLSAWSLLKPLIPSGKAGPP
jgi:membrane protein implicated in regulation of membrane protease activity